MNDQLFVKSVTTSKHLDWLKWLETDELVEFFGELLKLVTRISEGKKDTETLSIFLDEWRETPSINCYFFFFRRGKGNNISVVPLVFFGFLVITNDERSSAVAQWATPQQCLLISYQSLFCSLFSLPKS